MTARDAEPLDPGAERVAVGGGGVVAVRRYKLTSLGAVGDAARLVDRVLPGLTEGDCHEFISAMASQAGALRQIANPPAARAERYATDPDLGHACVDLLPRLRRTAATLLAGLIPSRPPGAPAGPPVG